MNVEQLPRGAFHSRQIFGKRLKCETAHLFFRRTRVHGIRTMRNNAPNTRQRRLFRECPHISIVDCFRLPATRVSREKRKRVSVDGSCRFCHFGIPFSRRKMTTDNGHAPICRLPQYGLVFGHVFSFFFALHMTGRIKCRLLLLAEQFGGVGKRRFAYLAG